MSGSVRTPVPPAAPPSTRSRPDPERRPSVLRGLLRTARPRQWAKNVLVVAAPGAAGVLFHPDVLGPTLVALVAFCLASSGTYLLNDAGDAEADRRHPTKRLRPVAVGVVPVRAAALGGAVLIVVALGLSAAVSLGLVGLLLTYLVLTTAYTLRLKRVAVVDIAVVASGFIFRAVAGGVAADVFVSRWFLIVVSFGSLFLVAGKRFGEHAELGEERGAVRATLATYSLDYLRFVWGLAATVAVAAYCLWAFEQSGSRTGLPWYELSIVPFVLFILRYGLLLESGRGGAPEELVLGDRALQAIALTWVLVFAGGVYLGR